MNHRYPDQFFSIRYSGDFCGPVLMNDPGKPEQHHRNDYRKHAAVGAHQQRQPDVEQYDRDDELQQYRESGSLSDREHQREEQHREQECIEGNHKQRFRTLHRITERIVEEKAACVIHHIRSILHGVLLDIFHRKFFEGVILFRHRQRVYI